MSRAADLSTINCTQCGAGLSVLGGGRVLSHICGYCGAVLDTQDNYKVLTSIGKRDHPDSPVKIGMTLTIEGVAFTVIGTIGKTEVWASNYSSWVEHQVFSDTHGYAWLTYEDGNFTFTRKVRDYNMGAWLNSALVESAATPPNRSYRGEKFKYYETSTSKIDFLEGEFNWVPAIDEETTTVVLLGPDSMLGLREGKTENEVELTRLLPRDELVAEMELDLDTSTPAPRHALTVYTEGPNESFLRKVFGWCAIAALILWAVLGVLTGPTVLNQQNVSLANLPQSFRFEADNPSQLAYLRIETNVGNNWAVLGVQITDATGAVIMNSEGVVEFYSGRDSDGSWTQGNRNETMRFRPNGQSPYELTLSRIDGTGGTSANVTIQSGTPTPVWMFVALVIFGIAYIGLRAKRALFTRTRFAGGDWHEE